MIRAGVVGLGMMGWTHLEAYAATEGVQVTAIADADEKRRTGADRAAGNFEGLGASGFDIKTAKAYADAMDLIRDPDIDLVDICLPTPLHVRFALEVLKAGKHLLVEKPLSRFAKDAAPLLEAEKSAKGLAMPAMVMRFWPGWTWLKKAVDDGRYGKVLSAHFRRFGSHPGGPFYSNGAACGGGILDIHIHDTDFVQYLFGPPKAVFSRGHTLVSDEIDNVTTHYLYDHIPNVSAEGGWSPHPKFPFQMQYTVTFEKAQALFGLPGVPGPLIVYEPEKPAQVIELEPGMGYQHEVAYFVRCIREGKRPATVTLSDAARAVQIVEAEAQSVRSGAIVAV